MSTNKIHLVCSGGGIKSFSYLGAINRLYRSKIKIESISTGRSCDLSERKSKEVAGIVHL